MPARCTTWKPAPRSPTLTRDGKPAVTTIRGSAIAIHSRWAMPGAQRISLQPCQQQTTPITVNYKVGHTTASAVSSGKVQRLPGGGYRFASARPSGCGLRQPDGDRVVKPHHRTIGVILKGAGRVRVKMVVRTLRKVVGDAVARRPRRRASKLRPSRAALTPFSVRMQSGAVNASAWLQ